MRNRRYDITNAYYYLHGIPLIGKVFRKTVFKEFRLVRSHKTAVTDESVYYIIRIDPANRVGVFAYYRYVLGHVIYALGKGYIPVVNMRDYRNMYIEWPNTAGINSWEFFFEQPAGIGVDEALSSDNVIISDVEVHEEGMDYNLYESSRIGLMNVADSHLRINKDIANEVERISSELFSGHGRICGIKIRGSDYAISQFENHAIPPTCEQAYQEIMDTLAGWDDKYEAFFLSTEDMSIVNFFRDKLGDKLIYQQIDRYKPDQIWYESGISAEERVKEGYEYCYDVCLLSKCDALITTVCQGAGAAVLINNGRYEHIHIIDRGVYK